MRRFYSTRDACQALGISRSALYLWNVEPDSKGPGARDSLGWSERTIRRLAKEHGRELDTSVFDDG